MATAALFLTLFVVATLAGCAQEGALVTATPADGSALAAGPRSVDLTFDRRPDLAQSHVGVRDSDSVALDRGELTAAGPRTVRQPIETAGAGTVVVAYHIVFDDGTQTTGSVRFSVGTGTAPAGAADGSGHEHGVDPLGASLLVVDLAVLIGVVVMLRLRPRRHSDDGPPQQ
jgi:methionine-rich copper-binding protein CopC